MTPDAELAYLREARAKIETELNEARAQAALALALPDMTPSATPGAVWGQTMQDGAPAVGDPSPGPQAQAIVTLEARLEVCDRLIVDALVKQTLEAQALRASPEQAFDYAMKMTDGAEGQALDAEGLRQAEAKGLDSSLELENRFGAIPIEMGLEKAREDPSPGPDPGPGPPPPFLTASTDAGNGVVIAYAAQEAPQPDAFLLPIMTFVHVATKFAADLNDAFPILKAAVNEMVEVAGQAIEELVRDDRGSADLDAIKELLEKPEKQDPQLPEKPDQQLADKQEPEAAREAVREAAAEVAQEAREAAAEAVREAALEAAREAARQAALEAAREAERQAAAQRQER